ncbi:MAG: hypothetical protein ACP5OR_03755 [Candidatus Dormibacteria bacterium]
MTTTIDVYRALHDAVMRATGLTSQSVGTDVIVHPPAFRKWAWFDDETGRVAVSKKHTDELVGDALEARVRPEAVLSDAEKDAFVNALDAVIHAEVLALYHEAANEPSNADIQYQTGSHTVVNGAVLAVTSLIRENVLRDPAISCLWPDLEKTHHVLYMADAAEVMRGICSCIARESGTTLLDELTQVLGHRGAKIPYLVKRLADAYGISIVLGKESRQQIDALEQILLRAIGNVEVAVRISGSGSPSTADGSYGRGEADTFVASVQALMKLTTRTTSSGEAALSLWKRTPLKAAPSTVVEATSIAHEPPSFEEFLARAREAVAELFGATVHVKTYLADGTISPLRDRLRGHIVLGRYQFLRQNGGELTLDAKRTAYPIRSFLRRVRNTPVSHSLHLRESVAESYYEAFATVLHEHIHALGPSDPYSMHAAMNLTLYGGRVVDEGCTELATSVFMVDFLRRLGISGLHEQFQCERTEWNYPAEVAFMNELVGHLAERYGEDPRAILRQLVTAGSEHGPLRRMAYLFSYGRPLESGPATDVAAGIILSYARQVEHFISRRNDLTYAKLKEFGRIEGQLCVGELMKSLTALAGVSTQGITSGNTQDGGLGAA